MKKILPIVLAAAVTTSTAYLTPLYPIYAQGPAMGPGVVDQPGYSPGKPPTVSSLPPKTATSPGMLAPKEEQMMQMQMKLEEMKERIATKSAALKKQLARFRDKAKAAKVENINTNLNNVNANVTSALEKNLANISAALEKLKAKAAEAQSAGKDASSLNSDIADVESQWSEADMALKAQMEKDYVITLNSESTVKNDIQTVRNTLRTDLKSVHTEVMEARNALADAVKNALSSL